jgi:hypothetical protein
MNVVTFATALMDAQHGIPEGIRCRTDADLFSRFGVYRNNIVVSLIDALEHSYPVIAELVGQGFFRSMARGFALNHPPTSPVMAEYGQGFAMFIETYQPAASLPYLSDVARLEWQCVMASQAKDAVSLDLQSLQSLLNQPEQLAASKWIFDPSVFLIESDYAVASLWLAHQSDTSAEKNRALSQLNPDRAETGFLIRKGLDLHVRVLDQDTFIFIKSLWEGCSLGAAVEATLKGNSDFDMVRPMSELLALGSFIDCIATNSTIENT